MAGLDFFLRHFRREEPHADSRRDFEGGCREGTNGSERRG